jgi:hypothetical protein
MTGVFWSPVETCPVRTAEVSALRERRHLRVLTTISFAISPLRACGAVRRSGLIAHRRKEALALAKDYKKGSYKSSKYC